jgi:hypothetical protein
LRIASAFVKGTKDVIEKRSHIALRAVPVRVIHQFLGALLPDDLPINQDVFAPSSIPRPAFFPDIAGADDS